MRFMPKLLWPLILSLMMLASTGRLREEHESSDSDTHESYSEPDNLSAPIGRISKLERSDQDECNLPSRVRAAMSRLDIKGSKVMDVGQALRKIANKNVLLVADALFDSGPMSFRQIQTETRLDTNTLNRVLREMKDVDLILVKDRKYHFTRYGSAILNRIANIRKDLGNISESEMLLPVETTALEKYK